MQMPAHEVWDIVSNMKQLVEKEPDKAKQMFVSHPQVTMMRASSQLFRHMVLQKIAPWCGIPPSEIVAGSICVHVCL